MTETRACQSCKQQFTIEPDDFAFYERIKVPPPTFCPQCRLKRRLAWRNERHLFRGRDAASGKEIFTGIPPQAPVKIYELEYWRSDAWDELSFGRDYDFNRPFFEQWRDLVYAVPWPSRSVIGSVNSDYSDQAGHIKNCYLCFNLDYCEDSCYAVKANSSKQIFDTLDVNKCELSYDSTLISDCFRCIGCLDCESSSDLWFSKNCVGCNSCFGCVNLRNKSYHIFNQPYSKEEYEKRLKEMNLGSRSGFRKAQAEARQVWAKAPVKFMRGLKNTNSTGEGLYNTKNARECWGVHDAQDIKWVQMTYLGTTDSYDYTVWGNKSARMYEALTCGEENDNVHFSFDCWPANLNLEYCVSCRSSSDCFACMGLRKKKYCIFNKQYSEEEYEALRAKIIEHMDAMPYVSKTGAVYRYGEFFPPEFSPFAYNETMLSDYYPLTKEEAVAAGYEWRDPETREYQVTVEAQSIPDPISEVKDGILNEILQCERCKRAFRIVKLELDFYRRIGLPLPALCVNCRYLERLSLLNPLKFSRRECMCAGAASEEGIYQNTISHFHGTAHCPNSFLTAYLAGRLNIVYCEACYNTEVV